MDESTIVTYAGQDIDLLKVKGFALNGATLIIQIKGLTNNLDRSIILNFPDGKTALKYMDEWAEKCEELNWGDEEF